MTSVDELKTKCGEQLNFEPFQTLLKLAESNELDITDAAFARLLDERDELKNLREEFHYPKMKDLPLVDTSLVDSEVDCIYFCGNSLGLQPKQAGTLVNQELEKWQQMGVHGHFHGSLPWWIIEDTVVSESAKLVGAKNIEVAIMNSLTVNLHLLMVPFYRPTSERHKILVEAKAFPSDHYAVQSQIRFHGYNPAEAIIEATPREGEELLRTEDILSIIEDQGDSIALVMFSGVQYYTGQYFDVKNITAFAQKKGCVVGWDLAHAVGNVELHLHDWNVDFACWCSYKYLNSGPGGIAGAFVHEKHAYNFDLPKFSGWWGHERSSRFEMGHEFKPLPGAAAFQLSNPPLLQTVSLLGSLNVFAKTSMKKLRAKSDILTAYLELLLLHYFGFSQDNDETPTKRQKLENGTAKIGRLSIITPVNPAERGCQLSVRFSIPVKSLHKELDKRGVVVDTREPDVMRLAPAPLYNSFVDVHRFVTSLGEALHVLEHFELEQ